MFSRMHFSSTPACLPACLPVNACSTPHPSVCSSVAEISAKAALHISGMHGIKERGRACGRATRRTSKRACPLCMHLSKVIVYVCISLPPSSLPRPSLSLDFFPLQGQFAPGPCTRSITFITAPLAGGPVCVFCNRRRVMMSGGCGGKASERCFEEWATNVSGRRAVQARFPWERTYRRIFPKPEKGQKRGSFVLGSMMVVPG